MFRQPTIPPSRELTRVPPEKHLPEGECRYIMTHPDVKGLRCACVSFSLTRDAPGSSCDCGHMACFHLPEKETMSTDQKAMEILKGRVTELEENLRSKRTFESRALILRVSRLEELLDKYRAEAGSEIKTAFRGLEGLWSHVEILQRYTNANDDRLEALTDASQAFHDEMRVMRSKVNSIDEISMSLEDRIDDLEGGRLRQSERGSSSPSRTPASAVFEQLPEPCHKDDNPRLVASSSNLEDSSYSFSTSRPWTVHVSLLPKASQPMPFEQNTAAYRRCTSRGLHRVVVISGTSSTLFKSAISHAFEGLLRGRDWMPLEPRICDAQALEGLPMLKQLHISKLDQPYDYEFLKSNCATLDNSGTIVALYIALRNDAFTWPELYRSAPFKEGLEACWNYDPVLDGPKTYDDDVDGNDDESSCRESGEDALIIGDEIPSAGDILRSWSPPLSRLKRHASSISRASSFGSADGDSKRARMSQRKGNTSIDGLRRRATEAV